MHSKIFSLSAFIYPDMFNDNWLKENLKYIMYSFPTKNISFCLNSPDLPYGKKLKLSDIQEEAVNLNLVKQENFSILDIILVNNNIVIYYYENLISSTSATVKLGKMNVDEITENNTEATNVMIEKVLKSLIENMQSFYRTSPNMKNNNEVRKITLDNYKMLGNLLYGTDCRSSFMEFMTSLSDYTLQYK